MKKTINSNFHTHTYLCKHAEGTPLDYVRLAKNLGYHTIGISDHAPLCDQITSKIYTRRMNFEEYEKIYLPEIKRAKEEEGILVLSALEIEYLYEMNDYYERFLKELDYLILGEHYIHYNNTYFNVRNIHTVDEIAAYKNELIEGIKTGYFKIVAHPDIYCWNYNTWDQACEKAAEEIITAAINYNVLLEINANGIRNSIHKNKVFKTNNGDITYGYPRYEFWKVAKRLNARVIVNDDSHWFKTFNDENTISALEIATDLGLNLVDNIN